MSKYFVRCYMPPQSKRSRNKKLKLWRLEGVWILQETQAASVSSSSIVTPSQVLRTKIKASPLINSFCHPPPPSPSSASPVSILRNTLTIWQHCCLLGSRKQLWVVIHLEPHVFLMTTFLLTPGYRRLSFLKRPLFPSLPWMKGVGQMGKSSLLEASERNLQITDIRNRKSVTMNVKGYLYAIGN